MKVILNGCTIALLSVIMMCLLAVPAMADYTLDEVTNADTPVSGTMTGSYLNTHTSDDIHEAITEEKSGSGSPASRYSYLEHKWTINVTGGNKVTFYVEAYRTANSENDNFVFAYSKDDSIYTNMVTVTKTADDGTYQIYEMPGTLNGTVYIHVKDTDQTGGNTVLDTIYVDHMYIRSVFDTTPPAITNATGDTSGTTGEAKTISATITDDMDVVSAVHYTPIDGTETTIQMTEGAGDVWSADVPVASDKVGTITYYITAEDEIAKITRDPTTGTYNITVTDNEAPSVISDLTATVVTGVGIELAWSTASDNIGVISYDVYRNLSVITDVTGLTPIANVTGTTYTDSVTGTVIETTYIDPTDVEETTYYYAVTAVDAAGNEGDTSNSPSTTLGFVLDSENTVYYLTSDIINSDVIACIVITADNVTLDCQGHIIDGNLSLDGNPEDNKYGIYSNNSHTTIKNGKISNWQNGIYLDSGADNGHIENNTITEVFGASNGGNATGIFFKSKYNVVCNNSISSLAGGTGKPTYWQGVHGGTGGTAAGIYFSSSDSSTITSNTIFNLTAGNGGAVYRWAWKVHTGTGGTAAGIYISSSNSSTITSNTIFNLTAGAAGRNYRPDTRYIKGGNGGTAAGIYISSSNPSTIISNTIFNLTAGNGDDGNHPYTGGTGGTAAGIYFSSSNSNSNLTSNIIFNLTGGTGGKNLYSGNGPPGGTAAGIYFSSSNSKDLTSNTIFNLTGGTGGRTALNFKMGGTGGTAAGIYFSSSNSNNLTSNTIFNLTGGIGGDGYGDYPIGYGGTAAGIYFSSSNSNSLTSNTISSLTGGQGAGGRTAAGIYLYSAANNVIYNNVFNSPDSYYFAGTIYPNRWNTTYHSETNVIGNPYMGGNYWGKPDGTGYSDTCWDTTGDYICEEPYALAANNTDYLPLTHNSDTILPSITINSPLPDAISSETIEIDLTVTDAYLDYTNISVMQNGNLISSTTNETNGAYTVTLSVQNAGVYNILATAYDLAGNSNSSSVHNLTVNLLPKPKITSPADGSSISRVVTVEALDESGDGDTVHTLFEYYEDTDCNYKADDGNAWVGIGSDTDGFDGWSVDLDTTAIDDGCYIIRATMGDMYGFDGSDEINVEVSKLLPAWQHGALIPWDAERLSTGNTLIAEYGNHTVIEVTPAGETVWQYGIGTHGSGANELNSPADAERLDSGNTLIVDRNNHRVIEVNTAGDIVWQYGTTEVPGNGTNQLYNPMDVEPLDNGNMLIADRLNNRVIEVNKDKTIVWEMTGLNHPFDVDRLDNGNTLIVEYKNHSVIEIDTTTKEIVWKYGTGTPGPGVNELNYPADAERLLNGDTLIVDAINDRVIEVRTSDYDPEKGYNGFTVDSIVWEYESNYPSDADRLSNNYTLISEAGNSRVIEVFTPAPKPKEYKPLTPILISGYVDDVFGLVDDPTVIITNLNTSEVFTAETIGNSSYYQVLTSSEHVCCAGNALHFNVSDNSGNKNITIHVVTEGDLNAGGFEQNITVLIPYTDMVVTAINSYHNDTRCPAWFNLSNEVDVTIENTGTTPASGSNVSLYIDGEFFGKLPVPGLNSEESTTVTFENWMPIGVDCLQAPCEFEWSYKDYSFTAVADCDNDVDEHDEANNETTVVDRTCYNGYMADDPLENVAHGMLNGGVLFTTGDSVYTGLYQLGSSVDAQYDITLPEGAGVELAHLNVYYTWHYVMDTCPQMEVSITNATGTHIVPLKKAYNDHKCTCPGAAWVFPWGNYVYDVTDYIQDSGSYTVTVTRTGGPSVCVAARGINLVYEDQDAPLIEYWINEGADVLMGGRRYPTSSNLAWWENINNATFTASVNTSTVKSATLGVAAPWAGSSWEPGMTNYLFFNDVKLGIGVYHGYGETYDKTINGITMHVGSTNGQVGVNVTNVTGLYLKGSDNVVGQCDDGDNMMPCNAFLVVEYGVEVPPKPDLTVTEKYETLLEDGTFSVNYTVKNIGSVEAGASNTTIHIDGVNVLEDTVIALAAGDNYTSTVGPFECTCNQTLNITVCADSDEVVDESDEGNNCLTNELVCPVCTGFIEAGVTFSPTKLDLNSNGVLKAYITLPEGYDVANISVNTVECEGADVFGFGKVIPGKQALEVKFKIQNLTVPNGDAVPLTVTGELYNGTPFEGSNTVEVINGVEPTPPPTPTPPPMGPGYWVSDSNITSGLGDVGYGSTPTVFYKDETWYLIAGSFESLGKGGEFHGWSRTGSAWQSDPAITSGLPDIGNHAAPNVFYKDGTWYLISGEFGGAFYGFNWTGSAWQSDPAITSGLEDVGYRSGPIVFCMDGAWYLIAGEGDDNANEFYGFKWTGSTWESDRAIVSGLRGVSRYTLRPAVFNTEGAWYLIAGEYDGAFYGWRWTGNNWQSDDNIVSGLVEVGYGKHSAPMVFNKDGTWYLITGDNRGAFYGFRWQEI